MNDEIKQLQNRLGKDNTPITRKLVKQKFINFITHLNETPSFRTSLSEITLTHIRLLSNGWRMPDDTLEFYYQLKDAHHSDITTECIDDVVWMEYLIIFQKFRLGLMHKRRSSLMADIESSKI